MQYFDYDKRVMETFPQPPARMRKVRGSTAPMVFEPTVETRATRAADRSFWLSLFAIATSFGSLIAQVL